MDKDDLLERTCTYNYENGTYVSKQYTKEELKEKIKYYEEKEKSKRSIKAGYYSRFDLGFYSQHYKGIIPDVGIRGVWAFDERNCRIGSFYHNRLGSGLRLNLA